MHRCAFLDAGAADFQRQGSKLNHRASHNRWNPFAVSIVLLLITKLRAQQQPVAWRMWLHGTPMRNSAQKGEPESAMTWSG
jgi:hypothetical protein